jgi:hypothetical protein
MQLEVGGKERADAFLLQQKGIDEAEANKLAAEQARIDLLKQGKNAAPLLQGKDERLLTRGTADPALEIAKEQLQELKKLNEPKSIGDTLAERETLQIEVIK